MRRCTHPSRGTSPTRLERCHLNVLIVESEANPSHTDSDLCGRASNLLDRLARIRCPWFITHAYQQVLLHHRAVVVSANKPSGLVEIVGHLAQHLLRKTTQVGSQRPLVGIWPVGTLPRQIATSVVQARCTYPHMCLKHGAMGRSPHPDFDAPAALRTHCHHTPHLPPYVLQSDHRQHWWAIHTPLGTPPTLS